MSGYWCGINVTVCRIRSPLDRCDVLWYVTPMGTKDVTPFQKRYIVQSTGCSPSESLGRGIIDQTYKPVISSASRSSRSVPLPEAYGHAVMAEYLKGRRGTVSCTRDKNLGTGPVLDLAVAGSIPVIPHTSQSTSFMRSACLHRHVYHIAAG